MKDLKIGIVGVTAEGAARAFRDLNNAFYKKYGAYHNPHILMNMQPLIHHVECFGDKKRWAVLLQKSVDELISNGASILWMPANSSHLSLDHINFGDIPFINMVERASAYLSSVKQKTLVLGTSVAMSSDLYFKHVNEKPNLIKLNSKEQEALDKIIIDELIVGHITDKSREFVTNTIQKYKAIGVENVFFACTELPCFFDQRNLALPVNDSIRVSINQIMDISESRVAS